MAQPGVQFERVGYVPSKSKPILVDVSLTVAAGSTTALLGRSGSGKTTLLRAVNGLVRPTAGRVWNAGVDVCALGQAGLIRLRRSTGYVIQETGLLPHMTVERNAGMPLELARVPPEDRAERVAKCLKLAGLESGELAQRYPWQLSGGQKQRVGLARALVSDPAVLLLDEPFGALDPITRVELQTTLRDLLARLGKTALLVTHDLEEALYLAERVVFLDAGEVVADLPRSEVRGSVNPYVRAYVAAVRHEEPLQEKKP